MGGDSIHVDPIWRLAIQNTENKMEKERWYVVVGCLVVLCISLPVLAYLMWSRWPEVSSSEIKIPYLLLDLLYAGVMLTILVTRVKKIIHLHRKHKLGVIVVSLIYFVSLRFRSYSFVIEEMMDLAILTESVVVTGILYMIFFSELMRSKHGEGYGRHI